MAGEFDDVDFTKEFDDIDFTKKKTKKTQKKTGFFEESVTQLNVPEGPTKQVTVSDDFVEALSKEPPDKRRELIEGLQQGLKEAGQGIVQLITSGGEKIGALTKEDLLRTTRRIQKQREEFGKTEAGQSGAGEFGRIVGGTAPFMFLPGGQANTLKGLATKGAAIGGGIGATQFVPEERMESGITGFLPGRLENTLLGGVLGGSIPLGLHAPSAIGKKLVNTIKGKTSPQNQEIIDLGAKHNVRLSSGDITQNPQLQKSEVMLENIPLAGTLKFRRGQADDVAVSSEKFLNTFSDKLDGGDDVGRIIQSSLKNKLNSVRNAADKMYKRVEKVSDIAGSVPTNSLNKTSKELIKKIKDKGSLTSRDKEIITILSRYTKTEGKTFSQLRKMRSDIGDEISVISASSGGKGTKDLMKAKEAIEDDLEKFAKNSGGEILEKWRQADSFYKNKVVPLKEAAFIKAAKTSEPDKIYGMFIQQTSRGGKHRATNFFNALDEKGKSAVRFGMINEAMEKATINIISPKSGLPQFSPDRFLTQLQKIKKSKDVFFQGQSKKELEGYMKLMDHVRRSGRFAENPPTGNRLIGAGLAGGAVISDDIASTILKVFLSTTGIRFFMTNPVGKRFLLASSKAKNPKQMNKIIEKINQTIGRSIVVDQTKDE